MLLALAAAGVVLVVTSGVAGEGVAPPVGLLLAWGSVIVLCTGGAALVVVRRDLSLPRSVVVYAAAHYGLLVLAKFVLAPAALYEVNRDRPLTSFLAFDQRAGLVAAGVLVFVLYAVGYFAVYRFYRRRLRSLRTARTPRRLPPRAVLVVLVAAVAVAGATGSLVVVGPLAFAAGAGLEYLDFVFASSVSGLIGLVLAVASWLLTRAFGTVAERAKAVGDATVLASFLWVGLAFLALYHALWVVYMLILVTIWPLRAVVPK